MSKRGDLKDLVKQLEQLGLRVEYAKRTGHIKVYAPDGRLLAVTSGTPSDHRGIKNFLSHLKRAGYDPRNPKGD